MAEHDGYQEYLKRDIKRHARPRIENTVLHKERLNQMHKLGFGQVFNEEANRLAKKLGLEDCLGNEGHEAIDFAQDIYLCWNCVQRMVDTENNNIITVKGYNKIYQEFSERGMILDDYAHHPHLFGAHMVDYDCVNCGRHDARGQLPHKYGLLFKQVPVSTYTMAVKLGGMRRSVAEKMFAGMQYDKEVLLREKERREAIKLQKEGKLKEDRR